MSAVLLPVILCGGSGTRLWPLSRKSHPKQFLALTGGQTMLQQTATRLRDLSPLVPQASAPILVCNEEHRFLAASQLMEAEVLGATILLEPDARNTAPALTIAALQSSISNGDPVLLAMPADHVVGDVKAFHKAVQLAYGAACEGQLATFGIVPNKPETGYGYIQHREAHPPGLHGIVSFVEKPNAEKAQFYLEKGNYLWNSGIFMLRASVWLKAIKHFRPDILEACQRAMQGARHDLDFIRPEAEAFRQSPSQSIDYAVMEKLPATPELGISCCVVRLDAGWSDLGAWDALWSLRDRDARGNALIGEFALEHGCSNTMLLASSRLVAGVGLKNLIVVETPDAVLVVDKDSTQDVRQIVEQLGDRGGTLAYTHRKVNRPWGWYDRLDVGERFQVKRIMVNPGASLSLQLHHHRAEHWVVVKGVAEVTRGERCFQLLENESTYISIGQPHRLRNLGTEPLELIEVQSGSYFGEDDIVRLDDIYGRAGAAD